MKKIKYSLPFVNEGKPFTVSNWTPEKHEDALAEMIEDTGEDKIKDKEKRQKTQDKFFKYYVILQSLREIDDSVSISDLKELHPDNLVQLFYAVYNAGKISIFYEEDFQKGEKTTPRKSSTGEKN